MEQATQLRTRDVLGYLGRDYVIEGVLTYKLPGKVFRLACAVDGDVTLWVEPLADDLDDRVLIFIQAHDLAITTPPPPSISYRDSVFVPRFSGRASVEVSGKLLDLSSGPRDVWRYRAAGDLYLQIEATTAAGPAASSSSGPVVLYGESVHRGMIDVLPGR